MVATHHLRHRGVARSQWAGDKSSSQVNPALKGAFTDLGRGFVRVMGVTKMTVMLGLTLALFNLDRIRSFRAKHHL